VLDTNVLSELTRAEPALHVREWISHYPLAELFTTSVTVAEIRYGIARLPDGRRKTLLIEAANRMFTRRFNGRILPFDWAAADLYSEIRNGRKERGRPMSAPDAQIASIVAVHGADLATRNTRDFEGAGITVINPWDA